MRVRVFFFWLDALCLGSQTDTRRQPTTLVWPPCVHKNNTMGQFGWRDPQRKGTIKMQTHSQVIFGTHTFGLKGSKSSVSPRPLWVVGLFKTKSFCFPKSEFSITSYFRRMIWAAIILFPYHVFLPCYYKILIKASPCVLGPDTKTQITPEAKSVCLNVCEEGNCSFLAGGCKWRPVTSSFTPFTLL